MLLGLGVLVAVSYLVSYFCLGNPKPLIKGIERRDSIASIIIEVIATVLCLGIIAIEFSNWSRIPENLANKKYDTTVALICIVLIFAITYRYLAYVLVGETKTGGKKYSVWVYERLFVNVLLVTAASIGTGCLLLVAAMYGQYSKTLSILWTCTLVLDLVGGITVLIIGQQKLIIDGTEVRFCSLKLKCRGQLTDIQELKQDEREKRITIVLNGQRLIVENLDHKAVNVFYKHLEEDLRKR